MALEVLLTGVGTQTRTHALLLTQPEVQPLSQGYSCSLIAIASETKSTAYSTVPRQRADRGVAWAGP